MSYRMTDMMQQLLGYDQFGNNFSILAESDRIFIEEVGVPRASGDVICKCGSHYYIHPHVQGALWATRTCQGIVKL